MPASGRGVRCVPEGRRMPDGEAACPVPVVIIAGALGAGKTSLINAMLVRDADLPLAVIVNDFGAITIDEAILSATGLPVFALKNGCICCSLQGDLLRALAGVLSAGRPIGAIVIEASGVSDPRGIIEALHDPVLRRAVRLDAVVTVVDVEMHDVADDLWQAQVRAADIIVLAKAGEPAAVDDVRARLAGMGKSLVFIADESGGIPLELLLGQPFQRERVPLTEAFLIRDDRFVHVEWTSPRTLALTRFRAIIEKLAPRLVRAKGLIRVLERPDQTFLFQLVGRRASLLPSDLPVEGARLVLIGRAGILDAAAAMAELEAMAQE